MAVKSLRRRTEIPSVFIQDIELTKEEQNTPVGAEPRIIRRRKSDSFLENVTGEESTSTSHVSSKEFGIMVVMTTNTFTFFRQVDLVAWSLLLI